MQPVASASPLIGITSAFGRGDFVLCRETYPQAIAAAGGVPLIIPAHLAPAAMDALVAALDGLLLTGGQDISPGYYGGQDAYAGKPVSNAHDPQRDATEMALFQRFVAAQKPILGICRGMQLINVVCGGTLCQDIPTGWEAPEIHQGDDAHPARHPIAVEPGSRLATALGVERHTVNSFHHQALAASGTGVRITAWAPDGVPEGMELAAHPFALAVQFHPERSQADDAVSARLFAAFVAACRAPQTADVAGR